MMNRDNRFLLYVLAGIGVGLSSVTAVASDFLNAKPLLKDATSSNMGVELIVPLIRIIDRDGNGDPDRVRIRLRIYDPASGQKLYETRERTITPLAADCGSASVVEYELEGLDFLGENDNYTGVFLNLEVVCDGVSSDNAVLYLADSRGSDRASWIRTWALDGVSAHITNWDDDSSKEVMVVLAENRDTRVDIKVKMLSKATGNQELNSSQVIATFED